MAFLVEQQRKRQIRHAFEHYVPPQVVEQLVAHPEQLSLGGRRREITLLFSDLSGFTAISEQMSPEEVAGLLNRHLTEMTQIILRHSGTVDKFIGDAIMAFWGAPLDDPEQATHACQAAQEMQAAMALLRAQLERDGLPSLHMRIGVHSGIAAVGNMGSADRFAYTAIGDAVNLASRLEGINKLYGTEILISDATARHLGDNPSLRRVDRVRVKGKHEAVEIFTFHPDASLVRLNDAAIHAYRDREWDKSLALWHDLLAQSPQDGVAQAYARRIEVFRATPPPDDWEGVVSLEKM